MTTFAELARSQYPEASADSVPMLARQRRNEMLAGTDWTQLPDAPCNQQAWAVYRQQLRDAPAKPNWPDVDVPDSPTV